MKSKPKLKNTKYMIALYLMNKKGLNTLQYLISKEVYHLVAYVVGAKDKNVQNDFFIEIKKLCTLHEIIHFEKGYRININTKYKISIGWRWIITEFENLIVLHDSLLPKYRGFAPLVNCLINGEKEIGVTALFADKEYDTGDIIVQKKIPIKYPITIAKAIEKISVLYAVIVYDLLLDIKKKSKLTGIKQNDILATYSVWLDNEDYFIDWSWEASKIKRKIDATGFPYMGAKAKHEDKIITINDCKVLDDKKIENRTPGKIIGYNHKRPIVICGKGLLQLNVLIDDNGDIFKPKLLRKRFK